MYYYTTERNVQQIIYLLKEYGIKKIIASPGTANISFVASVQRDPYFEVFSAVDERSAAYMACGMAAESGSPVVLSCTMATASRNYISGLTEAFYRKLPVLALTSAFHYGYIGSNHPQIIDRRFIQSDIAKYTDFIDIVDSDDDEWANEVKINKALSELTHNGGGPVHLNLLITGKPDFSCKELPKCRIIKRVTYQEQFPSIPNGRTGIFVGSHKKWSVKLTDFVDSFCEQYNSVVLVDHTSNYQGKYGILGNLIFNQLKYISPNSTFDLLIEIGDISGAYMNLNALEVWRVNPDGEIRDYRRKLKYVFEMEEIHFFSEYVNKKGTEIFNIDLYKECQDEYTKILNKITDINFSGIWIAWVTSKLLPINSVIHFGILNSLRSWNYFEYDKSILGYSNTGGFGIDGNLSSLVGASLMDKNKLFIGIIGDLAFFYDINSLGNRHIGTNLRIILVNNGKGTEFRQYICAGAKFGDETDKYIAAAGHFGNKSQNLVRGFVEALGFIYMSAHSKEEYMRCMDGFFAVDLNKSIVLEVFTDSYHENKALEYINSIEVSATGYTKYKIKSAAREILGNAGTEKVKKILKLK